MGIIVAIVATKGGAGKSTTAVALATSLDESIVGPVDLIDTDSQATASSWLPWRSRSLRPLTAAGGPLPTLWLPRPGQWNNCNTDNVGNHYPSGNASGKTRRSVGGEAC